MPPPETSARQLLLRTGLPLSEPVMQAAEGLGGSIVWALIEHHLLAGHRDLAVLVSTGKSRERLLEQFIAQPEWPHAWGDAGRALFAWLWPSNPVSGARQLSLEWDCRPDPGVPFPFITFEHAPGHASSRERALTIAEAFCRAVDGRSLTPVDESLVNLLPVQGSALHLACLGSRGAGARRWIGGMPPATVGDFLRAVKWPGDAEKIERYALTWGGAASHVSIHLDSANEVGPKLGLEIFYPGPPATDRRWAPLMRDIRDLGLGKSDAVEGLTHWPGRHNGLSRLLDMKVVFDCERPVEAKAYLAFCATEELTPGA